jgi:hypothetical protein
MSGAGSFTDDIPQSRPRLLLGSLIVFFMIVCCLSFALAARDYGMAYIFYDPARLHYAAATAAAFATIVPLFVFARFSFGYFVGFYFYTMILGYLWLNCFSPFNYDHRIAGASAAFSAIAFLLPALFITSPLKPFFTLSARAMQRLPILILAFAAATAIVGASYNFRLISVDHIYGYREQLYFPTIVNYATAATMSVLLPYGFACFLLRKQFWWAGATLLIAISFYPITLSKVALFTPAWLVLLAILAKISEARTATILSLLLPVLAGTVLFVCFHETSDRYFNIVNLRMVIAPSSAMDFYNEYFTRHGVTHFCQLWILRPIVPCSLHLPLSVEMANNYGLGNMNASLFATEGIASVGVLFAPVSAFVCGLIISIGNRLSAGLPAGFVLISSAILPQILLNVPLATTLLTHGAALLFLLWYITPRATFGQRASK